MKILAVGGGSGGHVTPVVAVLREIRSLHPKAKIRFWCDKKFATQAKEIVGHFDKSIKVSTIFAGKLRRYHHMSMLQHLISPAIMLPNIRDGLLVFIGFFQSVGKLIVWRPDVIFTKGGFVCLPVGFAARLLHIPLVIHDSDAHPGLTNRVLGRWASAIATGAPLEYYNYPAAKSHYVGIPISSEFHRFTEAEKLQAKRQWGVKEDKPLIVVTGGGLGARRINDAVAATMDDLLPLGSVVLISGDNQYDELRSITPQNNDSFQLYPFISHDMATLLGAADVVVTRAGATTILELAALAVPTILIPNITLTGGHQLKNAAVYAEKNAVIVLKEEELIESPQRLVTAIHDVLIDDDCAHKMAQALASFSKPNAAKDVAKLIIDNIKR